MTDKDTSATPGDEIIPLRRSLIDKVLIGVGAIATVVFVVAGALLMWGANFSNDYVYDELSSQNISFPPEEALREEGRDDLVEFAGEQVTTGKQAEAYASFINGHLANIADGQTYSEIQDGAARQAVQDARDAGASEAEIEELQATADQLTAQRDSLFRGETLRGLLLSSYAWSMIGTIAMIAAWVSFAAAVLMAIATIAGIINYSRMAKPVATTPRSS